MTRVIFIASIVILIALSGMIGYWSASSSFFAGSPSGSNSVMEIPMQAACDSNTHTSGTISPKQTEELPNPGVCQDDWINGWDVPTYNCDVLFGPV